MTNEPHRPPQAQHGPLLDETDLRRADNALSALLRRPATATPGMRQTRDKIERIIRAGLSPPRHGSGCGAARLADMELVGTRAAAQALGWSLRRVQRRRADLGGRYVGDTLVFDAAEIRAYAEALRDDRNGETDDRPCAS